MARKIFTEYNKCESVLLAGVALLPVAVLQRVLHCLVSLCFIIIYYYIIY